MNPFLPGMGPLSILLIHRFDDGSIRSAVLNSSLMSSMHLLYGQGAGPAGWIWGPRQQEEKAADSDPRSGTNLLLLSLCSALNLCAADRKRPLTVTRSLNLCAAHRKRPLTVAPAGSTARPLSEFMEQWRKAVREAAYDSIEPDLGMLRGEVLVEARVCSMQSVQPECAACSPGHAAVKCAGGSGFSACCQNVQHTERCWWKAECAACRAYSQSVQHTEHKGRVCSIQSMQPECAACSPGHAAWGGAGGGRERGPQNPAEADGEVEFEATFHGITEVDFDAPFYGITEVDFDAPFPGITEVEFEATFHGITEVDFEATFHGVTEVDFEATIHGIKEVDFDAPFPGITEVDFEAIFHSIIEWILRQRFMASQRVDFEATFHGITEVDFEATFHGTTEVDLVATFHGVTEVDFEATFHGITEVDFEATFHGIKEMVFEATFHGITEVDFEATFHGITEVVFEATFHGITEVDFEATFHGITEMVFEATFHGIIELDFETPFHGITEVDFEAPLHGITEVDSEATFLGITEVDFAATCHAVFMASQISEGVRHEQSSNMVHFIFCVQGPLRVKVAQHSCSPFRSPDAHPSGPMSQSVAGYTRFID
eukprot:1139159-Pelagomonas_calceolata.AAC.8